ncbi:hypothetical protein [Millisia brevis]|uniref:hypothetical protein n=1 Tax=Millisia brevis TaxID=264148 RepID=UPI000A03353D|nr:hypothetical protein [Millisia brevis]
MIVDCGDCVMRNKACADCVVGVLLGVPEVVSGAEEGAPSAAGSWYPAMPLQQDERDAMAALAEGGLVPHLRLVTRTEPDATTECVAPRAKGRTRRIG